MKVWIVTEGEYSAYHIQAVFGSEAEALAFAVTSGGDVEEWATGAVSEYYKWRAEISPAGDIVVVEEEAKPGLSQTTWHSRPNVRTDWASGRLWLEWPLVSNSGVGLIVYGPSREGAIKIAREKWAVAKQLIEASPKPTDIPSRQPEVAVTACTYTDGALPIMSVKIEGMPKK